MARYREIKKYGTSYVIRITKQDLDDLCLEINDLVDISDINKKVEKDE